jgi:hypothetical protein
MSGSIRWFNYTSDNGQTYALSGDKSNIQAVNPSGAGTPGTLPTVGVPKNIKVRYALFSDTTGLIRRKVPLLKQSDVAALTASTSFVPTGETATVTITAIRGEKVNLPKLADTGRTN